MNDEIPKDTFWVQYMKVDDIIAGIMSFGRVTLLAKFDVESTYHIVPVMVLLRYLSMYVALHSFAFTARHVAGSSNLVADALS